MSGNFKILRCQGGEMEEDNQKHVSVKLNGEESKSSH